MISKANTYDCIVVGAGMGGLTAACLLARKGKKVLVLERNNYPGGYCSVFERGVYKFESAIHAINGLNPGGRTRAILERCNIFHKLKLLEPAELLRLVFPRHDIILPQKNIPALKKVLTKAFPDDKSAIDAIFKVAEQIFNASFEEKSDSSKSVTWKYKDTSLKEFLDQHTANEQLQAVLAQYWGYLGVGPQTMSAIYYLYMFWDYAANGAYYIEGGSETAAKFLAEEIKSCGGEVRLGEEVKEFKLTGASTISHLVTKDGMEYFASDFISNISAKKLFLEMVDNKRLPTSFMNKMSSWGQSASAFVLYIGLKKSLRELGVKEYEIFLNTGYDTDLDYRAALENDMKNVQMGITIYSNLDATMCPPDRSALSIFILSGYDYWKTLGSADDYAKKKKEFIQTVLDRCDKLIPGFLANVDHIEAATPLTLEKYSGSFKGALYGWSQGLAQSGFRRQKNITPIDNLILTGAWTRPGGGFSSVVYSGSLAEEALSFRRRGTSLNVE